MTLRLNSERLNIIGLMLVKVKQKPFSYYEKIISYFSVVEMNAKVQLRLVVLVGMWGANCKSLKYESYIKG